MMSPRTAVLLVLSATLLLAAAAAAVEVAPGSLVRWPGEGIERCGMTGEEWEPIAGACWYPIDLLREPGPLQVWRRVAGERQSASVEVAEYPYPQQEITIEDDSKVNLSPEDVERARRESAEVGGLWPSRRERSFELPLAPPLEPLPEGGRFGARRIFNDQPRSPHTGADYSVPAGTPVHAAAAGRVVLADEHFFAGNSVFLDHGDGLITMYFHLSSIAVAEGETVERGQRVGAVGATGRATGPHLHFGVRWRGERIDPELLFAAPDGVPSIR